MWLRDMAEKTGVALKNAEGEMLASVNLPRHPTQLYEGLFEGIVMGIVITRRAF